MHPAIDECLTSGIQRHGLARHEAALRAVARLSLQLRVDPRTDVNDLPLGASRLGGVPDLPMGWEWAVDPEAEEDGRLLDFQAQINLAELPPIDHPAPRSGWLYLFAQQEDACENAHVLKYYDGPLDRLQRCEPPADEDFSDEDSNSPDSVLAISDFIPTASLPDRFGKQVGFSDEEQDAYGELWLELLRDPKQKEPSTRMFGYASELAEPGDDWELVLEVQSFFHQRRCYMNFWDAGCLIVEAPPGGWKNCVFTDSRARIRSN